MRRLMYISYALGGLLLVAALMVSAETPKTHPAIAAPSRRTVDPQLNDFAQAIARPGSLPVPVANYIDEFIFGKMKADHIPHAGLSSDEEFLRRIHIDLTGRLPEPAVVRKFLADPSPNKRTKLIDELMATPTKGRSLKLETPFLDRWTYFFCDLFRVSNQTMEKGRNLFRDYIYLVLLDQVPYDQFVRELLTASSRSNWLDGPINFLTANEVDDFDDLHVNQEDSYDEIAITAGKLFLGVNLECVSCHNGKGHLEKINLGLSRINRDQLWRQASFFSHLRITRPYSIAQEVSFLETGSGYNLTSKSVRRMPRYKADVNPEFLLTGEQPRASEPWREAFARMLTSNPQFARATVNLFWAEMMGAGIVDPPFAFDLARQDPANPPPAPWTIQPTHPELLNALAADFQAHHYDLRYLIRLIATSNTYQLSSHFDGQWKDSYSQYFARHIVRRLSPEAVADAVSQATGHFDKMQIRDSDKHVNYVMQTYAPEDVTGKGVAPMRDFLSLLGQGTRNTVEKEYYGSMVEASALLNSRFIMERVKVGEQGRLHDLLNHTPPLSNDEITDEMFLAFLGRLPNSKERAVALSTLGPHRDQGLEDLAWSLINMPEFVLNF